MGTNHCPLSVRLASVYCDWIPCAVRRECTGWVSTKMAAGGAEYGNTGHVSRWCMRKKNCVCGGGLPRVLRLMLMMQASKEIIGLQASTVALATNAHNAIKLEELI